MSTSLIKPSTNVGSSSVIKLSANTNTANNWVNNKINQVKSITTQWNNWTVFIIVMIILLILIITVASTQLNTTDLQNNTPSSLSISSIALIFEILLLVVFLCIIIFSFKDYIGRLSNVIILFIYIYALIIFFTQMPKDKLDKYAYIILPLTLIFGFFMFYIIISEKVPPNISIIFERIKYIITFVLLIVFMIIFYVVNPGGYIHQYFGTSMVLTILLAVFGLLYLLTVMMFPSINISTLTGVSASGSTIPNPVNSMFKGFSLLSILSCVLFIIFLTVVTIVFVKWPNGFINDFTAVKGFVIVCVILIAILWLSSFAINITSTIPNIDPTIANTSFSTIGDIFKRILLLLFGIIFSCILITWLVTSLQNLSSQTSIGSFILNLIIVIVILAIVYKIITLGDLYKKSHMFKLIINIILYIPCIFVTLVDTVVDLFGTVRSNLPKNPNMPNISKMSKNMYNGIQQQYAIEKQSYNYVLLLGLIILAYIVYFCMPYVITLFNQQGGKLLINSPVNLNTKQSIGSFQELNWSKKINGYANQYAISFWIFIDAASPTTINGSNEKYTTILDYGNKPTVLYNASKNILMITMKNVGQNTTGSINSNPIPPKLDDNGDIIIYSNSDVLLQKWNNIIINYNSGILDIFYNGDLVKTVMEVVPYMKLDALTIGSNQGINGGICNVNYFNTSLSIRQIYYLYNLVKDKTPPITINTDIINTAINKIDTSFIDEIDYIKSSATALIVPEIKTIVKDISNNILSNLVPPNLHKKVPNYLSLEWYFLHNNNDIYNL